MSTFSQRAVTEKLIGKMPIIHDTRDMYKVIDFMNWYQASNDLPDSVKDLNTFLRKEGREADRKALEKIPDQRVGMTLGAMAFMKLKGVSFNQEYELKFLKKLKDVLSFVPEKTSVIIQKNPNRTQNKTKISIQNLFETVEEFLEEQKFKQAEFLANQASSKDLAMGLQDKVQKLLIELESTDEDLVYAYRHLDKPLKRKWIQFLKDILDNLKIPETQRKARKIRKPKTIPVEKLIANFKFKKEDLTYQVTSIDPKGIVGAKEVYIFNTRYRSLMRFVSETDKGFTIRKSFIEGYDTKTSYGKKLRKSIEQIKEFMSKTKLQQAKFVEQIKTTSFNINSGRITEDCLILKINR